MDGSMDGSMDKWMDQWINGWMNEQLSLDQHIAMLISMDLVAINVLSCLIHCSKKTCYHKK